MLKSIFGETGNIEIREQGNNAIYFGEQETDPTVPLQRLMNYQY